MTTMQLSKFIKDIEKYDLNKIEENEFIETFKHLKKVFLNMGNCETRIKNFKHLKMSFIMTIDLKEIHIRIIFGFENKLISVLKPTKEQVKAYKRIYELKESVEE